jgi:hypothetical protein
MVENTLLPGTCVAIIGGKYRNKFGVLRYETEMRYYVLVDGIDMARYLSKINVIDATLAVTGVKVAASVEDLGEPLPDTNVESLGIVLQEIRVAKELI